MGSYYFTGKHLIFTTENGSKLRKFEYKGLITGANFKEESQPVELDEACQYRLRIANSDGLVELVTDD